MEDHRQVVLVRIVMLVVLLAGLVGLGLVVRVADAVLTVWDEVDSK